MQSVRACSVSVLVVVAGVNLATAPLCRADDGFQWATVGAVGNQAYQGPGVSTHGRGRVDYTYNISKLEITTGQWLEFTNTFSTQTNAYNFTQFGPTYWGASLDTRYAGPGVKYKLRNDPNAAMRPVGGISWRDAARYCNWLHNGKSSDLNSLITGAYDTTTFGGDRINGYTDAATHLPGAKYWIPTFDEWLKAAYYDPDRYGDNVPGWWAAASKSDTQGISGLPGVGTTSAGLTLPSAGEWAIPLGAYPQSVSPWGLLDTSGGASEFTEEWASVDRRLGGAAAGWGTISELISFPFLNDDPQGASGFAGLRIASVPAAGTLTLPTVLLLSSRRRRLAIARTPECARII